VKCREKRNKAKHKRNTIIKEERGHVSRINDVSRQSAVNRFFGSREHFRLCKRI